MIEKVIMQSYKEKRNLLCEAVKLHGNKVEHNGLTITRTKEAVVVLKYGKSIVYREEGVKLVEGYNTRDKHPTMDTVSNMSSLVRELAIKPVRGNRHV